MSREKMSDFQPEYEYVINCYTIGEKENVEGTASIRVPIVTPEYIDVASQDSSALPAIVPNLLASHCNSNIMTKLWMRQFDDFMSFFSQRYDCYQDINQSYTYKETELSLDYFLIISGAENDELDAVTVGEILLHLRRAYACLCENDLEFTSHLLALVSAFRENLIVLLEEREKLVGHHQIAGGAKGNQRRSGFTKQWIEKARELAALEFRKNATQFKKDVAKKIRPLLIAHFADSDFEVPNADTIAGKIKK